MVTEEILEKLADAYFSFKCDECGKIIAAPADEPAPHCCEHAMVQIG